MCGDPHGMSAALPTGRRHVACPEPHRRLLVLQTALAHSCTSRMQGVDDGAFHYILSSSYVLANGRVTRWGLQALRRELCISHWPLK